MDVTPALWLGTIVLLVGIIIIDLVVVDKIHGGEFGPKQATRWVIIYVGLAILFGLFIWTYYGHQYGGEFFAGYITEYSLSVDNLFVFIVIISSFAVPKDQQHKVLLVGVVIALILRAILILVGAAAIQRFAVTFYLFGALLLFTAIQLVREDDNEEKDPSDNLVVRLFEKFMPTTNEYHGGKYFIVEQGKRYATPMLMVMLAIGTTDLLFALDSIPAIFGLTQEPYLVFTANAFALMGLRQLYFLVSGLLDKLIYLSIGLAVILAFIGVKLILHAIHETTDLNVPEITIAQSLGFIIAVLAITTTWSLIAVRRNPALISPIGADLHSEELRRHSEHLEHLGHPESEQTPPDPDEPDPSTG